MLSVSSGLVTPRHPPKRVGRGVRERKVWVSLLCLDPAPDKQQKMDGWL